MSERAIKPNQTEPNSQKRKYLLSPKLVTMRQCTTLGEWLYFQFGWNFRNASPKTTKCVYTLFPHFFPFSALTACICNKCVWLSLFASVFFRFHNECRKNWNWACLSGSCCSHTRQGFYHGNESNDGFIQFYNYVMS